MTKYTRSFFYLLGYRIYSIFSRPFISQSSKVVFRDKNRLLASLFEKFGSDKGSLSGKSRHNYHLYYELFFAANRTEVKNVLEIGIGTNNEFFTSSMGRGGTPGASLRAFRDFFPNAKIFGLDIDKKCLIFEDRISSAWVDQRDLISLNNILEHFRNSGVSFDLIIDDGLHTKSSAKNTLETTFALLRPGGLYVIEDIPKRKVKSYLKLTNSYGSHCYFFCGNSQKTHRLYTDNNILFIRR